MKIKACLTIFVISFILILFHTDINAEAISDISESLVAIQLDFRIDNFNGNSAPNWNPEQNIQSLNITQAIAPYPFKPFNGGGCLAVQSAPAVLNGWRYIKKTYSTPYDFSESNIMFAAVNMPELADSYDVALIIDGSYTVIVNDCKPGTWNGIFFDISGYENKNEINSFTIGVKYNSEFNYNSEYIFYIDMVGGFRNVNISNAVKYLSSDFYTSGGTLIKNTDSMILEINDENPYIETYSFNSEILSGESINSIKLKFKNNSDCQAVSFFYTTARNPSFSQERSYIIAAETEGDVQTCYFPLPASLIDQIRILFNDATYGEIEILSIVPSSSYIPLATGYGTVDECVIASNKIEKEIHISGTLTEDAYNEFRGTYLELYALGINDDSSNAVNHNLTPIAQVRAERSFSFTIPFDDTIKYMISSKFIVVAETGNERIIIDTPKFITNPEILAGNKYTHEKSNIKKGMTSFVTESQILGIKYTYITINAANLITFDETGYQHIVDGYSYYFAADYVNQLDDSLKQYYNAGIIVTAILNLKAVSESQVNNIFIHPDADRTRNVSGYAFNTTTSESIRYLRAVFDFLAYRYSSDDISYGRITNYVIGNKVGNAYMNYNMGEKSLFQFVESYATVVRLAYNTIKSISSASEVYISLDYKWDNDMPADNLLMYDNRALLDTLSAYFKGHGDINWNLAFDMYPDTTTADYILWTDTNAVNHYDTNVITARNIETLCRYMSRRQLWYISNATPRSILLIEQTSATTEASFVYSFYKVNMRACSLIEAYIINRSNNDNFNNIFKNIDTDKSFETTDYLKPVFGISEWSDIIDSFDSAMIIRRTIVDIELGSELPYNITGSAILWQFSDTANTDGWQTAEYCDYITTGNQLSGRSSLLKAQLLKSPIYTEYRGIENKFQFATDLSCAPLLSFNVQISTLPANVTSAELVLLIKSGESYIQSTGIVNSGNWNNIVLDMSEFTGIKSIDNIKIWLRGINGQTDLGEPLMFISDMIVHSMEFDSDYIINNLQEQRELHLSSYDTTIEMRYVWILITIIIVATTLLTINILNRRKVTDREEDWYDRKY